MMGCQEAANRAKRLEAVLEEQEERGQTALVAAAMSITNRHLGIGDILTVDKGLHEINTCMVSHTYGTFW